MKIVIPSLKRAGKVDALKIIPDYWMPDTYIAIGQDDYNDYRAAYPNINLLVVKAKGIANVREEILNGPHFTDPKIVMVDDDCRMGYRTSPDGLGSKTAKIDETNLNTVGLDAWNRMNEILDTYAHAGFSEAMLNRSNPDSTFNINFKALHILCYNKDLFPEGGVKFNRVMLREDYDVTLQLLEAGKPNYIEYLYTQDAGLSNKAGGCSEYRNAENQTSTAYELQNLHPGFVRLKDRKPPKGGGWFEGQEFKDVVVYWKKAYESSKEVKQNALQV